MTRPATYAETLPPQSLLKRAEILLRGDAPKEIRRRGPHVTIEDGAWGAWAPTPAQARLIGLTRASPVFQAALRIHVALMLDNMRPGPIDHEAFGLKMRFYPMLAASFRHMLLSPSIYQKDERAFLGEHASGEGVFVDIGANAGVYTIWAGGRWPGRRTISFEPHPLYGEILERNVAMAGLDAVTVLRAAASGADGTVEFSPSAESVAYGGDTVTTPARGLLSALTEAGATAFAGLKIDAEGVEDDILIPFLADAPEGLLPRAVVIEHVARHLWDTDVISALEARGYRTVFRNNLNSGMARVA